MSTFRLGRNTTAHYSSFADAAKDWGCKPVSKTTKNENKLKEQRERFAGKHKCKACNQPMTYIGGNQMVCQNEKCKGIKVERYDKDGNLIVSYVPSFDLLDSTGAAIAHNIFFATQLN